jgi:hypothetical protein
MSAHTRRGGGINLKINLRRGLRWNSPDPPHKERRADRAGRCIMVRKKFTLPPSIFAKVRFSSLNSKIGQNTPLKKSFVLPSWPCYKQFWRQFYLFLFILIESLKNYSKSQKNHKIKNSILLDFTWVDLHREYIICFSTKFFCNGFRSMLFCN